jgi:hypothetical protein
MTTATRPTADPAVAMLPMTVRARADDMGRTVAPDD